VTTLTSVEALALADKLDDWPAGLGFVVEATDLPRYAARGWRRLPGYKPFAPPPPESETVKHCPVVQLHESWRTASPEPASRYYAGHLAAFWTIANSLAELWGVSSDDARLRYNELLREHPRLLAIELRQYAKLRGYAEQES
jgi:hypothetical protein